MKYQRLGASGMKVSIMAFGGWQIGDPKYWGVDAEADAQAAVAAAIDAGINLFDTAEVYGVGESERVLGRALGTDRDRVLIAAKVKPEDCGPERLRAACEASLQRLCTDRIDLYQVHWPPRHVPFEDAYGEMQRLREEGKVRAIGVSNFGCADLEAWSACGPCVSNQLGYSLLFRAIEYEIAPACLRHQAGILVYMPLLQGILTGRWKSIEEMPQLRRRTRHFACTREGTRHGEPGCETLLMDTLAKLEETAAGIGQPLATVALAWAMARPGVTSVIVGARNPRQLLRNVAAVELDLDTQTMDRLDAITEPLKHQLGTNADMWLGEKDSRIR
jgi:aryl-alcohol dehydrogenase-like predicted oxidoreductase